MITGCAITSPMSKPSAMRDGSLPTVNSIRTVSSSNSIGLEWDYIKDTNVKGYYVYRSKLNETMRNIARVDDGYSTHYLDENLEPNMTYRYMMKSYGDSGVSNDGIVVVASTAKSIDSISFAQMLELPDRIKIIWRPHANLKVDSYIVERADARINNWSKIAEVKGRLSAEYIDTKIINGMQYQYRIRVRTLDGEISEPSQIILPQTKVLPEPAANLQATLDQPKKIILTWDSPTNSDVAYYQIYSSTSPMLPFILLSKTSTNSYDDLINENGVKRYYKVTTVNKNGTESKFQDNPVMGQTSLSDETPASFEPAINNEIESIIIDDSSPNTTTFVNGDYSHTSETTKSGAYSIDSVQKNTTSFEF